MENKMVLINSYNIDLTPIVVDVWKNHGSHIKGHDLNERLNFIIESGLSCDYKNHMGIPYPNNIQKMASVAVGNYQKQIVDVLIDQETLRNGYHPINTESKEFNDLMVTHSPSRYGFNFIFQLYTAILTHFLMCGYLLENQGFTLTVSRSANNERLPWVVNEVIYGLDFNVDVKLQER